MEWEVIDPYHRMELSGQVVLLISYYTAINFKGEIKCRSLVPTQKCTQ